jgi:hypothetical protein
MISRATRMSHSRFLTDHVFSDDRPAFSRIMRRRIGTYMFALTAIAFKIHNSVSAVIFLFPRWNMELAQSFAVAEFESGGMHVVCIV